MSWRTVARNDLRHLRRSRMGQTVAALLLLVTVGAVVGLAGLVALDSGPPIPRYREVLLGIASVLSVLLPLIALIGSYGAIVSERKMGSIRFLLGLPNSRLDAYLGKFVARSALVAGPLTVGLVAAGVLGAVAFRRPSLTAFLAVLVASVVYALIFVGFGLTISAAVETETRAVVGIVGVAVVFRGVWTAVQWGALQLTTLREYPSQPYDWWYYLLGRFNPINAYVKVTSSVADPGVYHPLITQPHEAVVTPFTGVGFAAFALVAWLCVAPWLGYARFRDRDLP